MGNAFDGFDAFSGRPPLRRAIGAATLAPETELIPRLIEAASLSPEEAAHARPLARRLVEALRARSAGDGLEGLIREYDLSSEEGVALMCLAEALLRIPDAATRDALIRDKVGARDWRAHLGHSPSLFVNAATWGLMITGRLSATSSENGLSAALFGLIARGGEPIVRAGVDLAVRMLGRQFVMGRTIEEALARAEELERRGFRYSYDMLGEAAATAEDADRYFASYEAAIRAIGRASAGRGVIEGPGVSIKLSALHPRYERRQRRRVLAELAPRLAALARLAREGDVGLNIDAEEAARLDLSLDLLEGLCLDPALAGWNGVGFVVQAYGKRAPAVIDWLVDLARRSRRTIMLRLVKGAYWDGEIKRAQTLGLWDFPVFTRKAHTDVCYLACARKMLAAGPALYPQFATHNALTIASIHALAGDAPYEFQCLHGMGEPLYEEAAGELGRACRIYAPVGSHQTLLAYLVRRLLENGANSSFVNRVADEKVTPDELLADPAEAARAVHPVGAPHPALRAPRSLFEPQRRTSAGIDLSDESVLAAIGAALERSAEKGWRWTPLLADGAREGRRRPVVNPARARRPDRAPHGNGEGAFDVVGEVVEADLPANEAAMRFAAEGAGGWAATPVAERAARLEAAADLLEVHAPDLYGLLIREAGKTIENAVAEAREAVDFLRYYAAEIRAAEKGRRPLGVVVCISPWNFPLAIFLGQVAAALAAGNAVVAKPAEETPLIAAQAVAILREAGVPPAALQLLPGGGEVGAALVADPRCDGALFTGSTAVARLIQRALADRLGRDGRPIPLVAETGGQNAMVADSTALSEQVVADAIVSAFDSAGQRCSALRLLCLQEECANRILSMLKGAAAELAVGDPARLGTDVGPLISAEAKREIEAHVAGFAAKGRPITSTRLPSGLAGHFVAPTIIEIDSVAELAREAFGPVLHVLRYRREAFDELLADIAATGYGLTFGLHTRLDETVERALAAAPAGNVYVNRNMVGAVVGAQPFGGRGLSGTGPKAGGPLYLRRLAVCAAPPAGLHGTAPGAALDWAARVEAAGMHDLAARCRALAKRSPLGASLTLPSPAGERNVYELRPRGAVLCRARSLDALVVQIAACLACGSIALIDAPAAVQAEVERLAEGMDGVRSARSGPQAVAALVEDDSSMILAVQRAVAERDGPVVPVHVVPAREGDGAIPLEFLCAELSVSVNTAAAGGDAGLLALAG